MKNGEAVLTTYPKSGSVARVKTVNHEVTTDDWDHHWVTTRYGNVEGVPPYDARKRPQDNGSQIFIVSAIVLAALEARGESTHFCAPGELVRDAAGNVVGCAAFICGTKLARMLYSGARQGDDDSM